MLEWEIRWTHPWTHITLSIIPSLFLSVVVSSSLAISEIGLFPALVLTGQLVWGRSLNCWQRYHSAARQFISWFAIRKSWRAVKLDTEVLNFSVSVQMCRYGMTGVFSLYADKAASMANWRWTTGLAWTHAPADGEQRGVPLKDTRLWHEGVRPGVLVRTPAVSSPASPKDLINPVPS